MSEDKKTLKCRICNIAAAVNVEGERVIRIRCPNCKAEVSGNKTHELFYEQSTYLVMKAAHDIFSESPSPGITVGPEPIEPVWDFYLD